MPGIMSGILSGVGGLMNAGASLWNVGQQAKAFKWQKQAQAQQWMREDNSVQRRALDLEAAGLSKTLAAGQGAMSSAPIKPIVPQIEGNPIGAMLDVKQAVSNIAVTRAQENLINKQADNKDWENKFLSDTYNNRISQIAANLAGTLKTNELLDARRKLVNEQTVVNRQQAEILGQKVEMLDLLLDLQRARNPVELQRIQAELDFNLAGHNVAESDRLFKLLKDVMDMFPGISVSESEYKGSSHSFGINF